MSAPFDFTALANPAIQALVAYDPGHDVPGLRQQFASSGGLLELGSNENCYGPSATVVPALMSELSNIHRYPDPAGNALKLAIANMHGVLPNQIVLGNGSHELLMQFAQVFTGPDDEVLVSRYSFAVYPIAAKAAGANLVIAEPYAPDADMPLGHDLDAMLAKVGPKTKLICFANPNNPTGTWFSFENLHAFLSSVPVQVLVVVDEAYIEYATADDIQSAVTLLSRFPNLIVSRTFSKAYGLAGIRAGFALANESVIALIERIRESFNLNSLALIAAQLALADKAHLHSVQERNQMQREVLRSELNAIGLRVLPSQTNFLLVHFGKNTAQLEKILFERGVMVRPMIGYGLGDYLRVTVSTADENRRFLNELKQGLACL